MTPAEILEAIRRHRAIKDQDLSGVDLAGRDLTGGLFQRVRFAGADLSRTVLGRVGFQDCDFTGARFDGGTPGCTGAS